MPLAGAWRGWERLEGRSVVEAERAPQIDKQSGSLNLVSGFRYTDEYSSHSSEEVASSPRAAAVSLPSSWLYSRRLPSGADPLGRPATAVYEGALGSHGSGAGDFDHPAGIAAGPEGEIWVVDQNNDRIQEFDASGEFLSQFGSSGSGPGEFGRPTDIAIDSSGNLWVTDAENDRIEKFDTEGEFIKSVGSSGSGNAEFAGPEGIAAD